MTQPSWTDVMTAYGTLGSSVVTLAAVGFALYQSHIAKTEAISARTDVLQARKDEFIPLVSLDWVEGVVVPITNPNAPVQPHGADLKRVSFNVTNVSNAPALNVSVEVDGYGSTSSIVQNGNLDYSPINMPKVHLMGGKNVELVKQFTNRVVMPQTLKVRLSYKSVLGTVYCSEWFKVEVQNRVRVPVSDFVIPSAPITELP